MYRFIQIMHPITEHSQSVNFASRTLPSLFHSAPWEFLRRLDTQGSAFLLACWSMAGEELPAHLLMDPVGLDFEIRPITKYDTLVLIIFPAPRQPPDPIFAALIHRPLRVTPILGIGDTTKVLVLESAPATPSGPGALLVEWTRRLNREVIERCGRLSLGDFYLRVSALLEEG